MLTDFQNSSTDRLSGKFAIRSLWNIPPHLRCVTILPCEISMFRNCLFLLKTFSCNSRCQNWATPVWYLSILVSMSMGPTIVTCCCYNSCYPVPTIRQVSGDFIFQQDSAPAHRVRETISLLERETPAFISPDLWPPNSPDLNPVDYKIWSVMQQRVYQTKYRMWTTWSDVWLTCGLTCSRASLTMQLTSGRSVCTPCLLYTSPSPRD